MNSKVESFKVKGKERRIGPDFDFQVQVNLN